MSGGGSWLTLVFSGLALSVSAWTLWTNNLKRGTVKMTKPTTIFFGPDERANDGSAKIYLRALLYSTSRRGRVVESLFVRLRYSETVQAFPVWVYGNKDLARGSGIFVGPEGVAANHHFLLPKGHQSFSFKAGKNTIDVIAKLVGDKSEIKLGEWSLDLSSAQAESLGEDFTGIYFDWGGDSKDYVGWVEKRPEASQLPPIHPAMLALLAARIESGKE